MRSEVGLLRSEFVSRDLLQELCRARGVPLNGAQRRHEPHEQREPNDRENECEGHVGRLRLRSRADPRSPAHRRLLGRGAQRPSGTRHSRVSSHVKARRAGLALQLRCSQTQRSRKVPCPATRSIREDRLSVRTDCPCRRGTTCQPTRRGGLWLSRLSGRPSVRVAS